MGAPAKKLMAVDMSLPIARQPLADSLAKVAELKRLIEANQGEQDAARAEIRAAEATIEKIEESLKSAPALERRGLRKALEESKEHAQDWTDHLDELKRKGGTGDYIDAFGSLAYKLRNAEDAIKLERSRLLQSHPHVHKLLRRLGELRGELNQVTSDIYALERVSGIPKASENWCDLALRMDDRPHADPELTDWINRLLSDPSAELPG
jgi:chromosome segregation ATPase